MYIKLIQPKMKMRPMDTYLKIRMSPPLGLLTIANCIDSSHVVSIENENIQKKDYLHHNIVHTSRGCPYKCDFSYNSSTNQNTLDWIVKNRIETVTSHILTPYSGTALYDTLMTENRIVTDDLSLYNTAHVVFKPKGLIK